MALSAEQQRRLEEFLSPPRIAVVATIGRTGMPQLTPNWYRYSKGVLTISTTRERVKYRNLSRDPRLAVCICSEPLAREYAVVTGKATFVERQAIWPETRAIVQRYVEAERLEAVLEQMRTQNRVIIRMTPDRVRFRS
ncbi:MAG: PPOX class F420-dependent oxidoreductase [Chloroflexi bacterium]|nr:PPOX class F420-dependent oxidoreductase [Chloroflexota bacterium]